MERQKMAIEKLKFAPYNPRRMKKAVFEKLKENIRRFKVYSPLIVNMRTWHVVGGNQRLRALLELGYTEVNVVSVDLSIEEEMALNLALNKLVGEFDNPSLPVIFQEIMKTPELLNLTGFEPIEVFHILDTYTAQIDEDFDIEKEISQIDKPVTVPGDIVEVGLHKFGCFDTAKKDNLERLLGDEKISLLHMDLPYGCAYDSRNRPKSAHKEKQRPDWKPIENDDLVGEEYLKWLREVMANVMQFLVEGAPVYLWGGFRNFGLMTQLLLEMNFHVANVITGIKPSACPGFGDYKFSSEFLLYSWRKGNGPHRWYGPKNETNVWQFDHDEAVGKLHPTAKPVSLARRVLTNSSERNDVVFDGCMGAGFNLIACQQMGRVFRGCEIEPLYVDVAVRRYIRAFGMDSVSPEVRQKYFGGSKNGKK
ncbi:MAG: DNA methyltransferase [Candidatus Omnitrophota bacterium]